MNANHTTRHFAVLAVILAGAAAAPADRGMIRPQAAGKVTVEEPAQRAIIAHNGFREILILQTDVKADRKTTIVEFMPLPSKPAVSLAPEGCLASLGRLVRKHNLHYYTVVRRPGRGKGVEKEEEAVRVVATADLGPHHVTVAETRDADAFTAWVGRFFEKHRLGRPDFAGVLRDVVAGYIERGLHFFAFDVVTVSPKQQTVRPLTYAFDTPRVYYPLVVTNLYGGAGTVELFYLLPDGARARLLKPGAYGRGRYLFTRPVRLQPEELAGLHGDLPAFMKKATIAEFPRISLLATKYQGDLRFEKDIDEELAFNEFVCARLFVRALNERDAARAAALTAVPFAFDGQAIVYRAGLLVDLLPRLFPKKAAAPLALEKASVGAALRKNMSLMPESHWLNHDRFTRSFVDTTFANVSLRMLTATVGGRDWAFILMRRGAGGYRIVALRRQPVKEAGGGR